MHFESGSVLSHGIGIGISMTMTGGGLWAGEAAERLAQKYQAQ
jgi:hypothetical protein